MAEEKTLEEQIETMQAALDRYKKENKKFRDERDALQAQIEEGVATDDTLNAYKERAAKAEAKVTLQSEYGIKDVDRIVKRLDLASVKFGEDGSLEGLSDQIKELKKDFPEVFDSKRRVGGAADASATGEGPKPTPTEAAVGRIFGR